MWPCLPSELCNLIFAKLSATNERQVFRLVCKAWRRDSAMSVHRLVEDISAASQPMLDHQPILRAFPNTRSGQEADCEHDLQDDDNRLGSELWT